MSTAYHGEGDVSMTWDGQDLTLHGHTWENVGGAGVTAGAGMPVPHTPTTVGLVRATLAQSRRRRTVV